MSEEKLVPCSCGGEAKVIKDVLGFWAVECKSCLTRLGVSETKEEIIEAWNDMRRKEMSEEKLRRCPFCGGEAELEINGLYWDINCKRCLANVGAYKCYNKKQAIEAWNKRVADDGKKLTQGKARDKK